MTAPSEVAVERRQRRRAALVLLGTAIVLPVLAGTATSLLTVVTDLMPAQSFAVASAMSVLGALIALAAAVVAPGRAGPRAGLALVALVGVAAAGVLLRQGVATVPAHPLANVVATLALAALPVAVAALGRALGGALHERLARAWRTGALLTVGVAGVTLLLDVVIAVTFGGVVRSAGGLRVWLVLVNGVAGVGMAVELFVLTCIVRSLQALDGTAPDPLRPHLLGLALVVGAFWGASTALLSMAGV